MHVNTTKKKPFPKIIKISLIVVSVFIIIFILAISIFSYFATKATQNFIADYQVKPDEISTKYEKLSLPSSVTFISREKVRDGSALDFFGHWKYKYTALQNKNLLADLTKNFENQGFKSLGGWDQTLIMGNRTLNLQLKIEYFTIEPPTSPAYINISLEQMYTPE